jgi:hypothetical protein
MREARNPLKGEYQWILPEPLAIGWKKRKEVSA